MNPKLIIVILACLVFGILYAKKQSDVHSDYVPDEQTAIKIAEAIWLPIYGKTIYNEKPFIATLQKNGTVWYVHGTLAPGYYGGVVYASIKKYDCQVLEVSHGR